MLASVDEDVPVARTERGKESRRLERLRACPDDADELHLAGAPTREDSPEQPRAPVLPVRRLPVRAAT